MASDFNQNPQQPNPVQQTYGIQQGSQYPFCTVSEGYLNSLHAQSSQMATELTFLVRENEQLKNQRDQKRFRELAYVDSIINNKKTFTFGRNGQPLQLMDATIKNAYFFDPEHPSARAPFYMVEIEGYDAICFSEKIFCTDLSLINALQQHGIQVQIISSRKTTGNLLQKAINERLSCRPLPFYGGWQVEKDKAEITYILFQDFSICNIHGDTAKPSILPPLTRAEISVAVKQFWPAFQIIRTPFLREMLLLLFHVAALYTLLRHLGYAFPLAFSLFTTEQNICSYFKNLLSWCNNPAIMLDTPHADFSYSLLSRKDEPLLIEERGRLDHMAKNVTLLESAMISGSVPWKNGRDSQFLPLQALVVLLSSYASALNCSPGVMVLDFVSEDFDRTNWLEFADQVGQNLEYLIAFCWYTSDNISKLRGALAEGLKTARDLDDGLLTEPCLQAYGIFIGIRNFLKDFFAYASLEADPFPLPDDDLFIQLLERLVETSEKSERVSLSNQFVEIAGRSIRKGALRMCRRDQCPVDTTNVVLYDDDRLHFTSGAFFTVCQSMKQSRPVIIKALTEDGLLCGAKTNRTTAQTRITVCNVHGISLTMPVYSFARESFETFGDPLITEEEDTENGF